jgi:hypothetical protein
MTSPRTVVAFVVMDRWDPLSTVSSEGGDVTTLDLRDLSAVSSVSPSVLVHCSEAAAVMMREFHTPPQTAGTWEHDGAAPQPIDMFWEEPGEQTLITHGNAKDATEYGGYAESSPCSRTGFVAGLVATLPTARTATATESSEGE